MRFKFVIILISFFYGLSVQAQKRTLTIPCNSLKGFSSYHVNPFLLSAIKTEPAPKDKKNRAKFLLSFDNYHSFISKHPAQFNGLKIGIEYPRKFRWGFGFYAMKKGIPLQPIERADYNVDQKFNFSYVNSYFEYVVFEDYRWEFTVPVTIGTGWGKIDTLSARYNLPGVRHSDTVTVFTQGIAGHYKVFYWLGVGAGAGYREIITKDPFVRNHLNGPFYAIKIKLFLGGLYKTIFKHDQVIAERDEYRRMKKDRREERKQKKQEKEDFKNE